MQESEKLARGTQVIYVPNHAGGNMYHPDCEEGFVTEDHGDYAFVRYFYNFAQGGKHAGELRTRANSEATDKADLVRGQHHDQAYIDNLLVELGYSK